MAVNPNYPEPDTRFPAPALTQNPRYGEPEAPEEELEEELEETYLLDESLTHAALDKIAEERGVDLPSNLTKAEKIELLNSL